MKALSYVNAIALAVFMVSVSPAHSQEDYTFVANAWGPQVCLGRWIPPTDIGKFGVCEGQLVGLPQLTAISSRQSVDRLDQLLAVLSSIDQKMDINNDQVSRLIEVTANAQQAAQDNESLRQAITHRFVALPKELLADKVFTAEITKLREDILKEVEKRYPTGPAL